MMVNLAQYNFTMDFIKNKIIVRSLMSSVSPIILYSLGFVTYKIFDGSMEVPAQEPLEYFNSTAWLSILGLAVIYPINQICLWLLFRPIEMILDKKLHVDLTTNPILKGNFTPIK